ncbi:hypothetical protein C0995_007854 [Termitomyces sp. Mi166|nr:hypothetical protein C0995_007854 [Termitomyces sp. Mi166\
MSSSRSFPVLTIPQLLEKKSPPSPLPEHVRAPPGTPNSDPRNTDSDNDIHDEQPTNHPSIEVSQDPSPSDTPSLGLRKSRKRRKRSGPPLLRGIFHPTLILENSGSVARDHLASERTFLAYIRTSLLLASTGVALVQLFAVASANVSVSVTLNHVHQFARPLGATLVIFGLVVLAIGSFLLPLPSCRTSPDELPLTGIRRYFLIQKHLIQGKFPPTRFSLGAISIVTAIIIIIVFGILVSARN